jgi:sulfur relay (sulfurtransferase) DsrC/TusE family protein
MNRIEVECLIVKLKAELKPIEKSIKESADIIKTLQDQYWAENNKASQMRMLILNLKNYLGKEEQ